MARYLFPVFGILMMIIAAGKAAATENHEPRHAGIVAGSAEKQLVHLYFSDGKGRYLVSEERFYHLPDEPVDFGILLTHALFEGSKAGRYRVLLKGMNLRAFFITDRGTAVVDIDKGIKNKVLSCREELLAVFSIVNTLIVNISGIKQVKILKGGSGATTFAGHVDITTPLKADMLLIR